MLQNKRVIITGASSGIGQAQALACLAQGARVVGFDQQDSTIQHKNYTHIIGDVSVLTDVQRLPKKADIILNSAGILDDYTPSHETSIELWQTILAVNITGMFHVINHILPDMLAKEKGIIINMASVASLLAGGGGAAYTASKHAVLGYTRQLAYDYAQKGIRVNAIAPGAIQTAMTAKDFEQGAEMAKWVAEETPMKRWGQPEEIAKATLFLCSDNCTFMQGQVLVLDGGWSIK